MALQENCARFNGRGGLTIANGTEKKKVLPIDAWTRLVSNFRFFSLTKTASGSPRVLIQYHTFAIVMNRLPSMFKVS